MGFYDDMVVNDIAPLIDEYGADVILDRIIGGSYDPASGEKTGQVPISVSTKAIFKNYKYGAIDGQIVQQGDRMALISGSLGDSLANAFAVASTQFANMDWYFADPGNLYPKPGDKVTVNGLTWIVPIDSPGSVETVEPGGVPLVHILRIRK